jgi:hypothetical protein
MINMIFNEAVERSIKLRKVYNRLERQYHEKEWTVEEDALAFLTDAGLVGRLNNVSTGALANKWGYCL